MLRERVETAQEFRKCVQKAVMFRENGGVCQ